MKVITNQTIFFISYIFLCRNYLDPLMQDLFFLNLLYHRPASSRTICLHTRSATALLYTLYRVAERVEPGGTTLTDHVI